MATAFKQRTEQGGKFRVLIGGHLDNGPPDCECDGCAHHDPKLKGKNHLYRARRLSPERHGNDMLQPDSDDWDGDVVESSKDLVSRHGKEKFERLVEGQKTYQTPPEPFPLEKMTVAQLLAVAEEEEVDLKGATKAPDIIRILRTKKVA